jgi:selenide,water dikinase
MTQLDVHLTDLASCGGCAAKYSAARLEELLQGFVPVEAEQLLVGLSPADDAAAYPLDDERALVSRSISSRPSSTPEDYGTIAATNALNDVFAMGGMPLLARGSGGSAFVHRAVRNSEARRPMFEALTPKEVL